MLKGFILGIIVTLLVAAGVGYAALRTGAIPANADAQPGALEKFVAGTDLRAALDNDAPKGSNPVALTDANLIDGIHLYATHCAICHGTAAGDASAIAKGEYPKPPNSRAMEWKTIRKAGHSGKSNTESVGPACRHGRMN